MPDFGLMLRAGFLLMVFSPLAISDDTEIYNTSYAEAGQPNILFMLDSSGSMKLSPEGDELNGGENNPNSRYQIMKRVLQEVLASVPDTINVGLINYGGHTEKAQANGVKYPVTSLASKSRDGQPLKLDVREEILKAIDKFSVKGYTPIVQSLYESALYFRGDEVDYGASGTLQRLAHPKSYKADTPPAISKPGDPVEKTCNKSKGECPAIVKQCSEQFEYCGATSGQCDLPGIAWSDRCRFRPQQGVTYEKNEVTCPGGYDEAGVCPNPVTTTKTVTEIVGGYYECPTEVCTYDEPGDSEYSLKGTYKSPIIEECQSSFLVVMSDGEPDDGLVSTAGQDVHDPAIVNKIGGKFNLSNCTDLGDGRCGPELTKYLANVDQMPGLEGDQVVGTYAIGFAVAGKGQQYLRKLANLGEKADPEGTQGFYSAANEEELKSVFNTIVTNIAVINHDLAIPSISVDPETGLAHGDEVFFPFFRPGISPRWPGNLKKYKLDRSSGAPVVVDSLGKRVYGDDGKPVQDSRSYWLPVNEPADGADISAGGAARLLEDGRNILTTGRTGELVPLNAQNVDEEWFGVADDAANIDELIDYAYGIDSDALGAGKKYLHQMGDILHSAPVLVSYGGKKNVVFVGTNEGFLHAIDTETGKERFAFIPRELLPNLAIRKENRFGVPHPYGLDGAISIWKDTNPNDKNATGKTFLVIGMRRGGLNYYALDITDLDTPKLAWVIKGGADGTAGFEALGQTWSRAIPASVVIDPINQPESQPAFIFTGGYDPDYDQKDEKGVFAPKIQGGRGDAVFVVDARSGKKLWQADFNGEASSIPANPRVIDIDNNGIEDRIYVTDVEGRIFRIDLPDPDNKSMLQKVDKPTISAIADLGSNGLNVVRRRFFYEPDAALVVDQGVRFITLALGSGYRAHPLMRNKDIDQDYLFVVKDPNVYQLHANPDGADKTVIRPADLKNPEDIADSAPQYGWLVPLNKKGGEKALAKAVTLKNTVYFTTFQPETKAAVDVCSNATHTGRIYGLDVKRGKPALRFVDLKDPVKSVEFSTSDIPSEVVLVASRYEVAVGGKKTVKGVKFDALGEELKGLESPSFQGLNKWYWEAEK